MPRKKKPTDPQLPLAPPASDLRVLSFSAKWVAGIREAAIQPDGRAVLFEGRNASGKTSWLTALMATIGGGSLARLAHVGADEDAEPETVLVLGGAGGEYRVTKKGDGTAEVLARVGDSQAFADVPRPQDFLNRLFDPRMSNPVAWLMAKPRDQAILLLEALPLSMDEEALAELLADVRTHVRPVPAGLHPLEHLAMVRDHLFTARTGVNRDAKSKAQAAEQLRRELPAKAPEDPAADIVAAEARAEDLAAGLAREEEQQAATARESIQGAQVAHDQAAERIRADFKEFAAVRRAGHERRAAELRAEVERQIAKEAQALEEGIEGNRCSGEALIAEGDVELGAAREQAVFARKKADETLKEGREDLTQTRESLATLREQDEQATRFFALDEQAGGFEADAGRHEEESKELAAAMDRLDAFRRALAKDLPIPGLEIEGSEIRLDGIPLAQVNTQKRVEVAARVATARAELNPLKVLFLDGLEALDSEHREALLEHLVEAGVQVFAGAVTDGEPDVTYIGAVTAEAVGP